jgi:uncharacterized protein (DUF1800 family)
MTNLTFSEAAHLLRRAGFSGPPEEINPLVTLGREGAVNYLLDYERVDNQEMDTVLRTSFEFLRATSSESLTDANFNETEIRAWWLGRMLHTKRPFEEKMTLFWHNHFATSLDKVPVLHMYSQNLDLRRLALTRFDDLLLKISQGAAMLIWLDGLTNTKTQPNENFAREIQEVFSMGARDVVTGEPNYTEMDVKQIARAFAGWRFRKSANDSSPFAYEGYIDSNDADQGAKTIYGQTANFSGQDVITIIANRRSTARYLVKRLFEVFVYPLDLTTASDQGTVEKFADVYFANNHSIRELMRAIFMADEFFSERARFALIKTPIDFAIGVTKLLRASLVLGTVGDRAVVLDRTLRDMGMDLFKPPDVFGWKMNLGFINSRSMLERINFYDTVMGNRSSTAAPGPLTNYSFINGLWNKKTDATARNVLETLGPIELDDAKFIELQNYLTINFQGMPINWKKYRKQSPLDSSAKLNLLIRLVMSTPEFQLN